jgi:hypothetical protein
MMIIKFLTASESPCTMRRKNHSGIIVFKIYRAGRPPGSGEISRIAQEFMINPLVERMTITEKGIRKTKIPKKSIQALAFFDRLT